MKNTERQASLDKKKWALSQKVGKDMSGYMPYCEHCRCSNGRDCTLTQEQRVKHSFCATAYNRMMREN